MIHPPKNHLPRHHPRHRPPTGPGRGDPGDDAPAMRPDYLTHLSRRECPTCGHGLDRYVGHCGEGESHLARRTQAAARQRLAELHHCELDQLDAILEPPDPRRRWQSPIPQDAPPDVLVDLLRALIASAGITQNAAARLLGVAPRTVRSWLESGERRRQVPWSSVELLRRLLQESHEAFHANVG